MDDGVVCPRCGYVRNRACPVGALSCEARQARDQVEREGWRPLEAMVGAQSFEKYPLRTLRSYLAAYGAQIRFVPWHHNLDWGKKRTTVICAAYYRMQDLQLLGSILDQYTVVVPVDHQSDKVVIIPSAMVAKAMKGDHVAIRQWHQHQVSIRALEG